MRYIFHLLARVTAYVESESGRPDNFAELVNRNQKNPLDVEHIWPHRYDQYHHEFDTEQQFLEWRDQVAGLVLLPAAASLTPAAYEHQPQFRAFVERSGLPFRPYESFSKAEQQERQQRLKGLVNLIWSPGRLAQHRAQDS